MSGFQPLAMRATYFSLYASIQIKIYDSHLSLFTESHIQSREKPRPFGLKNRYVWMSMERSFMNRMRKVRKP